MDLPQLVNLTNMWRATGSVGYKRPVEWFQKKQTNEFVRKRVKDLAEKQKVAKKPPLTKEDIIKTTMGRYGGTYAHPSLRFVNEPLADCKGIHVLSVKNNEKC